MTYTFARMLSRAKKVALLIYILTNIMIIMRFSKTFNQLTFVIPAMEAPQPQSISKPLKSAIKTFIVNIAIKDIASSALLRIYSPESKSKPQINSIHGKKMAGIKL